MGIKSIPIAKFIAWIESKGLVYIRTHASHDHYNFPERAPHRLLRNVTVRTKDKDMPMFHIHTNLRTMGISKADFEKEIRQF